MAHIASCVANSMQCSMSKPTSPAPLKHSTTPPTSSFDKTFTWRMLPADPNKYKLFPNDKPLPSLKMNKTLDPEAAFEAAISEKQIATFGLRHRLFSQASACRRKASVPELVPMTTVQEIAMDSPTIPGRPPLPGRSVSVPNNRGHERRGEPRNVLERAIAPKAQQSAILQSQLPSRKLSPLVIPAAEPFAAVLACGKSSAKLTPDSTSPVSPLTRTRHSPSSSAADLPYPGSASTTDGASTATAPTPVSATVTESLCALPKKGDFTSFKSAQSDSGVPLAKPHGQRNPHINLHRGRSSESSSLMMDRGRPRKTVHVRNNNGPLIENRDNDTNGNNEPATTSKRRAFEELPRGWKPAEVSEKLCASDVLALQRQALEQAERFEVLKVEDVDALSKELRRLDERTEFLRRTRTSLRAGRRNLHSRICQYLGSPRAAKFSHHSLLKQEEALAELDASIDDWMAKLEQAENRRTRVRQKLLEHVAAAAIIVRPNAGAITSGSSQQALGKQPAAGPRELSTPPRSPSRSSFASQSRNASPAAQRAVAHVPSTIIEQPAMEDGAGDGVDGADLGRATGSSFPLKRGDIESIRVYAGDDVYALFADVENEMLKMGAGSSPVVAAEPVAANNEVQAENRSERERQQRQRQRSHEKLNGCSSSPIASPLSSRPRAHTTVSPKSSPATTYSSSNTVKGAGPFLTSAVFKP